MGTVFVSVLTAVVTSVLTALVTTVATGYIAAPRMEARKRRIELAHDAREMFNRNMLTIISACSRLKNLQLPDPDNSDCDSEVHQRLLGERKRWWRQIDESTKWMIDNTETFTATWPNKNLQAIAGQYAVNSRIVFLSERNEGAKLKILTDLTSPVHDIFFTYWWHRLRNQNCNYQRFAEAIELLDTPS